MGFGRNEKVEVIKTIYEHKDGKALLFGEAWLDYFIEYGCDPDFKDLYLKLVAKKGTIDTEDATDDTVLSNKNRIINARTSAMQFIRRWRIREWVNEMKLKELANRSKLSKGDYINIYNAIILNPKSSNSEKIKAMIGATKMLGIDGATKIEQSGGFNINLDYKLAEKAITEDDEEEEE